MLGKAFLFSFGSKYTSFVLQLATTLILARLIGPEEIGVYTIASICISYLQFFRDMGISDYLVKEKKVDVTIIGTCLSLMAIISFSIAFFLILSSGVIAEFYGKEDIKWLIVILSLNFLVIPFGSNSMALFKREMNFKPIFVATVYSTLANSLLSLGLAYYEYSYFSLAFGSLAGNIFLVLVLLVYRKERILFRFDKVTFRSILSFGGNVSLANFLIFFSDSLLEMIMGKTNGMNDLGLYTRAKSTSYMFNQLIMHGIRPVCQAHFADLNRKNSDISSSYGGITKYVLYLAFPFSVFLYLFPENIIVLLFGESWLDSAPLLKIIAIEFIISSPVLFLDTILLSLGLSNLYLKFRGWLAVLKIAFTVFLIGYGVKFVLYSYVLIALIKLVWSLLILKKTINLNVLQFYSLIKLPFYSSIVLILLLIPTVGTDYNAFLGGTISLIPASLLYVFLILYFERHDIRRMFKKRK